MGSDEQAGTILVAVDGSKPAEAALEVAIEIARCRGASLLIVSIYIPSATSLMPNIPPFPRMPTDLPYASAETSRDAIESIKQMLRCYGEKAEKAGVKTESKVISLFDTVGAGIIMESEKRGASLIVVGSRGLTGIKRTLLGSVADHVIKNARCDVYVARCRAGD
jgi:nucleotide-binding universal stress UspA family protein